MCRVQPSKIVNSGHKKGNRLEKSEYRPDYFEI